MVEKKKNRLPNWVDCGLDDSKSQDLGNIMADIWAQDDKLAQKNQEDLDKYWSSSLGKTPQ